MYKLGETVLLYVTYVETTCPGGRCEIWAQTDIHEYSKLERLVEAGIAKSACPAIEDIDLGDILLARYDGDSRWHRVQVNRII